MEVDEDGRLVVAVTDAGWLGDPGRVWPVVVDPTVTSTSVTTDCQLHIDGPNYHDCGSATGVIGDDGTGEHRLLFDVDVASLFDEPVLLLSASLNLTRTTSNPGSATASVTVHEVIADWDPADVTWNERDAGVAWSTAGGDFNADADYATAVNGAGPVTGMTVNRLAQAWVDGHSDQWGFMAVSSDSDYYRFHLSDDPDTSTWPKLWVRYNPLFGQQPQWSYESFALTDRRSAAVNVASGNLNVTELDVDLVGRAGMDATVTRTYNSRWTQGSAYRPGNFHDLGPGWQLLNAANVRLTSEPSGQRLLFADTMTLFPFDDGVSWHTPPGSDWELTRDAVTGAFTLTDLATAEALHFASNGLLDSLTDRSGNTISYAYDSAGEVASLTDSKGRVTTYGYTTANGETVVDTVTDPAGRVHDYDYTGSDLVAYTDHAGQTTSYGYASPGVLEEIVDAEGNITRLGYDADRRVTSLTRVSDTVTGAGHTWTFDYSVAWETVVTDPNSHATTYTFDRQGRVVDVTDALGRDRQTTWGTRDRVASYTDWDGGTLAINSYNTTAQENLESVELPTGAQTSFGYADSDNLYAPSAVTSAQGDTTSLAYDAFGRLEEVTDPQTQCSGGCHTTITYTADGSVDSVTDPRGNTTDYGYDSAGDLVSVDNPAPLGDVAITYDAISRPATVTDGRGLVTTYGYDAFDRITSIAYDDASSVVYAFDDIGNRTSRVDPTGTTATSYDPLNRVVAESFPGGRSTAYTWDGPGNLLSLTDPAGTVEYRYDAADQLDEIEEFFTSTSRVTTFDYSAAGQLATVIYPNGSAISAGYDAAGRQTSSQVFSPTDPQLYHLTYDYTDANNIDSALLQSVSDSVSGEITSYSYDPLDRLTDAVTSDGGVTVDDHAYILDAAGNITAHNDNGATTTYSYNAANQLTNSSVGGGTNYSYDGEGNWTASTDGDAFSYDDADRATSLDTNQTTSALSASYAGHTQVERDTLGAATYTTSLLGVTSETTGTTTVGYTRMPNGQVIARRQGNDAHYLLFDRQGSILAATQLSNGAFSDRYSYDPYGSTTHTPLTGASVDQPWRYTGQHQDPTGLYKMGLRYYHPELGRWTQTDPTGLGPHHLYASASPVNAIDPSGAIDFRDATFGAPPGFTPTQGSTHTFYGGVWQAYGSVSTIICGAVDPWIKCGF